MPYIKKEKRMDLDPCVAKLAEECDVKGDINYAVSKLIHLWVEKKGVNYQNLSDAKAALTDAASEFERTVISHYEDQKIDDNGYVSSLDKKYHNK